MVILRRPDHAWPLILGANRDEQTGRPWQPPGRHWPDRPDVIAGLDEQAGGSWMGFNDFGVVACILNRRGTLGAADGKRSRGEIVLDALDHQDAIEAADALSHLDGQAFRGFNLLLADNRDAYWLKLDAPESGRVEVSEIPDGLSMLTAGDLNDAGSPRIQAFLPKFRSAPFPDPGTDDWSSWPALMASGPENGSPMAAMCFSTETGFGTSSSALLALPAVDGGLQDPPQHPKWLFAAGPPDTAPYDPVVL